MHACMHACVNASVECVCVFCVLERLLLFDFVLACLFAGVLECTCVFFFCVCVRVCVCVCVCV